MLNTQTMAIKILGLNKSYDDFQLHDINLELPPGQIMGLVGANGAGKSTIMRILIGLIQADSGEVNVCGYQLPHEQVAAKREIGYASDDMRLYKSQTLRWHMDFIKNIFPGWDEMYAQQLLIRFDLRAQQKLGGFSHGQRVKALLLLTLARRPRLLLLDEPTTGLDPVARVEVLEALADILRDEERSVLFSSHNTMDIEQISDTISFIKQGRLVASADKETFLSSWRRILCQGTWLEEIKALPEVVFARNNGSIIELKVEHCSDIFLTRLQQFGLSIKTVEPMNLEDIFVSSV
ncbi:MAG: ABC transporter ATP-binding protein, partial [Gammaproteobacteria bacterium]|nr:ABC transporter ATP-binding protein [Gammaproteobacteria bacterium]